MCKTNLTGIDGAFDKKCNCPKNQVCNKCQTTTESSAITVDFSKPMYETTNSVVWNKCTECKTWFHKEKHNIEFAVVEQHGKCQACRGIVYYEVYELLPTDGGDSKKTIIVRDNEKDARAILNVLNETDIHFSVYGIRKVQIRTNKPKSTVVQSIGKSLTKWFDKVLEGV